MRENAYIAHMNVIKGYLSVRLAKHAAIGNRNVVNRGQESSGARPVQLAIGTWSKITAGHYVNVGETITIGDYSIIAGCGTQLWTHGFVHFSSGLERAEVRGKITIGENVYIGSHSTLSAGITIGDAVSVGAHSSVATSLMEPGVYVSQPLRHIARAPEERLRQFAHVTDDTGAGGYYWRPGGGPLPQLAETAARTARS
jgi:acetyltransferase-like isoleucine patch superfamily enzyme